MSHCNECANCQRTDSIENPVETHMFDGKWTPLCDDCAVEAYRQETVAEQLAALPSCEERQRIIDTAETTGEAVNRLRAHDLACNCTARKPLAIETTTTETRAA